VVRWIPIGPLTIQPAEIVRPFLLIFFAQYLTSSPLDTKKLAKAALLAAIPLILILIQPSLGVSILTALGFLGIVLSSEVKKTTLAKFAIIGTLLAPLSWFFMAPYQKSRILSIISPTSDPQGTGYNSIQSMITVGSGKIFGRGLGQGVQTQLSFLPERHTDFIFASISEELGLVGSLLVVFAFTLILYQIIKIIENSKSIESRAFCAGVFLTLFAQVMIHLAMNMAIFPITGIPLPLVSAGGSSLIATLTTLGIVTNCKKG
jgi:rod shape determining protein RodA